MIHRKLISSVGAVAALGAFSLAYAGSPADYFEKFDTDASGVVTEAEFIAYKTADGKHTAEAAAEKFAKIAGDDGEMTLAELETAMERRHQHHDNKADQGS